MDFEEFLNLCREADILISELLAKSPKLRGKRPKTLKASAVHYLARKKGLNVTLNNLYQIYGGYQETIFNAKKIIRDLDSDEVEKV